MARGKQEIPQPPLLMIVKESECPICSSDLVITSGMRAKMCIKCFKEGCRQWAGRPLRAEHALAIRQARRGVPDITTPLLEVTIHES